MKNIHFTLILALFLQILFTGCDDNSENNNTPNAFEDKTSLNNVISSKRYYDDLITQFYDEISEKNEELKKLNETVKELKRETAKKTKEADKFFENNQKYYNAAYARTEIIQDSILKETVLTKLSENENSFNIKTEQLANLLSEISQKQAELNDYYNAMKIIITMEQNTEYQNSNMPDTNKLKGLTEDYQKIIDIIKIQTKK